MKASSKYNPQEIEKKWQDKWAADHLYEVKENDPKPKFYALTMFPYTSGDLHIGHWYAMAPSDVYARYKSMQGYNVLHPVGFDAFGLPAENKAIATGVNPVEWTIKNVENMRRQLRTIGAIYDWTREVVTCLPEYYKWTEWFFLKLYEAGLAYRGKAAVNWCPRCQTVLANEQVVNGVCWRCDSIAEKKQLEQWFFRITKYADELLEYKNMDWPERIRIMQTNWIGKSHGADISFGLDHPGIEEKEIRVFTTRPDTLFGVTFFVLAPEHPLVPALTTPDRKGEVEDYIRKAQRQTEFERTAAETEKTGVFLGSYVINRVNGEKVPIWIADYVLPQYGTGAVMGVPAHDQRDFDFAKKYGIPIRLVVAPYDWDGKDLQAAHIEGGKMVNSSKQFDGLDNEEMKSAICDYLKSKGWGGKTITYRLRDWLISRQRYWGAPIPMIYCSKCGIVPVPEKDLPVLLPPDVEFRPTGESPLKYCESFVNTTCPKCGGPAKRETDTMDTFMCSSWYFLRYTSPGYDKFPFEKSKLKYWMPVDLYTGGAEHATMHLLYARFFIKAIRDIGLVDFDEPFTKLFNQGIIVFQGEKMSKSKGNVVTPDDYVSDMGADAVRVYLMFVGPWEQGGEWNDNGIVGMSRWLSRIWNLGSSDYEVKSVDPDSEKECKRVMHKTIKKASEDMERFRFNTMLAALMEYSNLLNKISEAGSVSKNTWDGAIKNLLILLAPSAPHMTEELWMNLGLPYSIHKQKWPGWDPELAADEEVTLVVQINGKVRDKLKVPASISEGEAKKIAFDQERVKSYTTGKDILKIIYVPGKLLNIVVK